MHYVGQRIVGLNYTIVYDEAIGSIGGHILLAVKFYAYAHSGALDEFILSRILNEVKQKVFSINESTLSDVSKQLIP